MNVILRVLIKEYLTDLKMQGGSKQTIKSYSYYLSKFIIFIEANSLDFITLSPAQARLYRNQIVEDNLKPRTINKAISGLKCFYDYLIEEGIIIGNPIMTRRLRVKEAKTLPQFMTAKELAIFKAWLPTIPQLVSIGFLTMLATGMRLGEVTAITCRDLMQIPNGGYVIRVRHGKGDIERYVPVMDADVARSLVLLKQYRLPEDLLIKVTAGQYNYWSAKCKKETGLAFYPHRCRHTVGTQLLQKGIALEKVQDVMGHQRISSTRHYAKTAQEAILELAAKADRVKETRAVYNYLLEKIF
ncbi:MAG TPA: hypothetical protein DEF34_05085 [Desulfotomaculum sp.]|nr:MAG: hypothetical protein JL56_15730 [Desulfotomaculum sp. BICA1-6]HBX22992.1 hypothetical protein [Desulfotomaculum sp.]